MMENISVNDFVVFTVSVSKEDYNSYTEKSVSGIPGLKSVFIDGYNDTNIAYEYNSFMAKCRQRFVIFCHQDVIFSEDLINVYLKFYDPDKIGAAGIIGKRFDDAIVFGSIRTSWEAVAYKIDFTSEKPIEVHTLDSCLVIVDKMKNKFFDEVAFRGLHCFVEDFCCARRHEGKSVIVLPLKRSEHIGSTTKKKGCAWGEYGFYRNLLEYKWLNKVEVKTT